MAARKSSKRSSLYQVREWRMYRVLSLAELAEAASIRKATLVDVEAGRRTPQPLTLRKLAKALKLSIADLRVAPPWSDGRGRN